MTVIGKLTLDMVQGSLHSQMAENMTVIGIMIKKKDMVSKFTLMVKNIMDPG